MTKQKASQQVKQIEEYRRRAKFNEQPHANNSQIHASNLHNISLYDLSHNSSYYSPYNSSYNSLNNSSNNLPHIDHDSNQPFNTFDNV